MLLFAPAEAHVGDVVAGIDLTVDGGRATIEASYGLVVPVDDQYRWVCHEAVTAPGVLRSPRYARSPDGAWLAWIPVDGRDGATLFRSPDACTWPAVDIDGTVTDAAFVDGSSALVTTVDGIWTSSDGGVTFARSFPPVADRRFGSVAHGDGESWATATDEAGGRLFLWHRTTGDWAEQELAVPVDAPVELRVLTPGAPGESWLVVDPVGADVVVRASDGSAEVVLDRGSAITDAAWDGARLWVVEAGLFLVVVDGDSVVEVPEYPLGIGITHAEGALWTAPQSYLAGAMLTRSTDGASFETLAFPDDVVGPLACPAASEVATICEPLWELLLPRIRGFDDPPIDTGTPAEPEIPPRPDPAVEEGCGCSAGAAGRGWPLLMLLGWRRRHTRCIP